MQNIPKKLKSKYFDIIWEFGLEQAKNNRLKITVKFKDEQETFYGEFGEVCEKSLTWLEQRGRVGRGELMARGLRNLAQATVNTILYGMAQRGVEIRFHQPKGKDAKTGKHARRS